MQSEGQSSLQAEFRLNDAPMVGFCKHACGLQRALERAQRSKRKERATTPDAAEALTALQDLDEEEKAEDKDDHDSLYAEPRQITSLSRGLKA